MGFTLDMSFFYGLSNALEWWDCSRPFRIKWVVKAYFNFVAKCLEWTPAVGSKIQFQSGPSSSSMHGTINGILNHFQKFFTLSNSQNTQDFQKFLKLSRFPELSIPQDLCPIFHPRLRSSTSSLGKSQFSSQNFIILLMHFPHPTFFFPSSSCIHQKFLK